MRLRLVLTLLLMFPKAVSCWPCRRFWPADFCVIPANTFDCPRAFMVSRRSFCFWPSWRLPGSNRLKRFAITQWGKLLGLDRAPEVRTLRVKVKTPADQNQAFSWSSELCKEWMAEAPQEAAVLYVDGHVRVYYGNTKQLPKHYIARA